MMIVIAMKELEATTLSEISQRKKGQVLDVCARVRSRERKKGIDNVK